CERGGGDEPGPPRRPAVRTGGGPALPPGPAARPVRVRGGPPVRTRGTPPPDLDRVGFPLCPLPGTRLEAEGVAGLLGVRPWLGDRALEGPPTARPSPPLPP